jgi:hypothetical protein
MYLQRRTLFTRLIIVIGLIVAVMAVSVGGSAAIAPTDKLLVWVGNGAAPGQHSAANPGQIAFINGAGEVTPIMDVPAQTTRVNGCGDEALSSDGHVYAFYVGTDAGNLYVMKNGGEPTALDDVQALTCLGSGTFRFSPDGARLGYIAYEAGAASDTFADGFLHVYGTADMAEQFTNESVTAFDLNDDGVAYVNFFTNDDQEADEAVLNWWDGAGKQEVVSLLPQDSCQFTSAEVAIAPDGNFVLVMGNRCKTGDTRTSWQLYTVNHEARSAVLAGSDFQPGSFLSFARSNNVFFAPSGGTVYFTVPDGLAANTVAVAAMSMSDMSIAVPIARQVVFPTYSGVGHALPESRNGWLAAVVTSPTNENSLYALHLANLNEPPIVISAGSRDDTISGMAFTPDASHLLFVSGGVNSGNNSLVSLDLASGSDLRVTRGRFGAGLVLSPSGTEAALLDWQVVEDPQEPPYANLVAVDLASGTATTLFEGADVVDGKVTNQRFAYPLAWARSGS